MPEKSSVNLKLKSEYEDNFNELSDVIKKAHHSQSMINNAILFNIKATSSGLLINLIAIEIRLIQASILTRWYWKIRHNKAKVKFDEFNKIYKLDE